MGTNLGLGQINRRYTLSLEIKRSFPQILRIPNTIHDGIKWTNKTAEENSLNIFDIQIIRTEEGKYETTVYRKKSASDRYTLPAESPVHGGNVALLHVEKCNRDIVFPQD